MSHIAVENALKQAVSDPGSLAEHISHFQNLVWNQESKFGPEDEVLRELAYDLDFYEPDPRARAEDGALFGEEEALARIRAALATLGVTQI